MDNDRRLHIRRDLLAAGYSAKEIQRGRRSGQLRPIRRGAYLSPEAADGDDVVAGHLLSVRAAVAVSKPGIVISHISAAALHGIDMWNPSLIQVHSTVDARSGGWVRARRHVHTGPLNGTDVVRVDDLLVTSAARTVIDCARTESFEKAVVIGDSALGKQLVTVDELQLTLESSAGRTGVARATRVVEFLDGRSESVGESRSRVIIHQLGLPKPELQHEIFSSDDGKFIGRTDFFWEEFGAIGEFDGMAKYQTPPDLINEKRREDHLRLETGGGIARWYWDHLSTPSVIEYRIRRAFARRNP